MVYRRALAKMPDNPTDEDRAWLRDIESQIRDEYPGWRSIPSVRADNKTLVHELESIAGRKAVKGTDAGKGLALYLKARSKALSYAQDQGYAGFGSAKAMRGTRDWLRDIASEITDQHPDFAPLWDTVFSNEMTDDAEEISGAA